MAQKKKVPVVEELFAWTEGEANLIGTKCVSCGTYYFPKSISCRNPNCNEKKVKEIGFSSKGKLYTYTIQYYPPPPPSPDHSALQKIPKQNFHDSENYLTTHSSTPYPYFTLIP